MFVMFFSISKQLENRMFSLRVYAPINVNPVEGGGGSAGKGPVFDA